MNLLLPRSNTSGTRRRAEIYRGRSYENQKFDESTGQIYSEIIAPIQSSDDQGWHYRSRIVVGPSYRDNHLYEKYLRKWGKTQHPATLGEYQRYLDGFKNSQAIGSRGARSLQDAAIECILQNISDITLEGIACLPIHIVRRLWHAVNQR